MKDAIQDLEQSEARRFGGTSGKGRRGLFLPDGEAYHEHFCRNRHKLEAKSGMYSNVIDIIPSSLPNQVQFDS